jgi:hypothetical protein
VKFDPKKWYFDTYVYVLAFLCVGPFILPLAWINPRYNTSKKIWVTALTLVVSALMALSLVKPIESILKYYQQVLQMTGGH